VDDENQEVVDVCPLGRHNSLLRAAVQKHPVAKPDAAVIRIPRALAVARRFCSWRTAATKIETLARARQPQPAIAWRSSEALR